MLNKEKEEKKKCEKRILKCFDSFADRQTNKIKSQYNILGLTKLGYSGYII